MPTPMETARMALFIASTYGMGQPDHPRTWSEWMKLSPNACDDFWSIAQDKLGVPMSDRISMPADLNFDSLVPAD